MPYVCIDCEVPLPTDCGIPEAHPGKCCRSCFESLIRQDWAKEREWKWWEAIGGTGEKVDICPILTTFAERIFTARQIALKTGESIAMSVKNSLFPDTEVPDAVPDPDRPVPRV